MNPDKETPLGTSIALYVRLGRLAPARAAIARLTRLEPQNAEAWVFLTGLNEQPDPALAARALRRVRQLDPSFRLPSR